MLIEAIVVTGIALYAFNHLREDAARRRQRPHAPSFEDMADAVETELRCTSTDGWQQFCTGFRHAPDASLLAASRTRLDVWRTRRDDGHVACTFIVTQDGKRYPWTLLFVDGDLTIASIGGPTDARYRPHHLSRDELWQLSRLHQRVNRYLNIAR